METKKTIKSSKSDRTRAEILAAAQALFAQGGFDNTTIRDVATRAKIDPAMVIRYFHNKDELFARAAAIDLDLPALKSTDTGHIGEILICHFLDIWEGSGKGMAIMLRSAASNKFAAEKMREVFAKQVAPVIATVGSKATAPRRAGLVSSQLLGLALCRYILKVPAIVALTREELIAHVGPVLQRYAVD